MSPPTRTGRCRLSIVIVTWNGWADLEICLESIRASDCSDFEVIVIDNASIDGTPARLAERFPECRLQVNPKNLGHGRGVNQGLRLARGEYAMTLDNDTRLEKDSLSRLLTFMDQHPEVAVVAPRIVALDGSIEESARSFPSALSGIFGRQSVLTRLFPNNRFSRRYLARENLDRSEPFQVQQVSAACMLFRRSLIDEVGLWDEGYKAYWVESDWCVAVNAAGGKVFCLPAARVVHRERNKRGFRRGPWRIWAFHQGAHRFYRKHYTRGRWDPRSILAWLALSTRAGLLIAWDSLLPRPGAEGRRAGSGT